MEDEITLDELYFLLNSMHENEQRQNKFLAAIQGVDLGENDKSADFEKVKQRAAAALAGKSEQEFALDLIGIEIEEDDD